MSINANKIGIVRLFVVFLICGFCSLLGYLFKDELAITWYQFGTATGIVSAKDSEVFASEGTTTNQGYVEYLQSDVAAQYIKYPDLPSVKAKLVIPRIDIEGTIIEGKDDSAMNRGFWHFPSASPFADTGNVVIIGHRYLKLPPHKDTFFHLDWVKVGDAIRIETKKGTISYKVSHVWIIRNTDTSILEQTQNAQLTLITCHPLWTSRERLVIIADKVTKPDQ